MGPESLLLTALWSRQTTVLVTLNNPLSDYWLAVNVLLDTILGVGFFLGLRYAQPRWLDYAWGRLEEAKRKAKIRKQISALFRKKDDPGFRIRMAQLYAVNGWLVYVFIQLIVWFGVIGVAMTLILSKAFVNPLTSQSNFIYDVLFARANDQPNGAHIWSYLMAPIIVFVAAYKLGLPKAFGSLRATGDIYQGVAVGAFFVAVHEGIWGIFYYATYYQFLSWIILNSVLRDVSFNLMAILFVLTLWKYPKRTIPMKTFLYPILLYVGFLCVWELFGLPITTINNPAHSIGLYQETPFFNDLLVNATEIASWVFLGAGFIWVMLRLKVKDLIAI